MRELRILLVDDNAAKRERVVSALKERLRPMRVNISEAVDYESALKSLQSGYFDLLILDLMLPAAGNGPSEIASRSLVRNVSAGTLVPPMHIIALTAFETIARQEQRYYDENFFALEVFSFEHFTWADKIAAKIRYLVRSAAAALQFSAHSFDLDVFVLTARYENEFVPVCETLLAETHTDQHALWRGRICSGLIAMPDGRKLTAVVACVGEMGMAPTAAIASQAMTVFRPRLLSMLGMCCGFSVKECSAPQKIMDAIVVRDVACWEEGKYVDQEKNTAEFLNRSKVRVVNDSIRNSVEQVIEEGAEYIQPTLRRVMRRKQLRQVKSHFGPEVRDVPNVKFGTLVSGSSVIADENMVKHIIARHPTAVGLDMELYGLYTAVDCYTGSKPAVLGIKGVADFGHSKKDDTAQKGATVVAAEVFKAIVPRLPIFGPDS